ncbi:MAG: DUF3073 domain-containing protein [Rhodoglobus sp.]
MGRGRQKAKHTKVARDLKYFSPETNYGALAKELSGPSASAQARGEENHERWPEFAASGTGDDDLYVDRYATDDDDDDGDTRSA